MRASSDHPHTLTLSSPPMSTPGGICTRSGRCGVLGVVGFWALWGFGRCGVLGVVGFWELWGFGGCGVVRFFLGVSLEGLEGLWGLWGFWG